MGDGDSFVFDTGPGCGINYNVMRVPASRMTKIFYTHLHMDRTSDLAWMYAFGPAADRYTPLQLWALLIAPRFTLAPSSGLVP
jgi:ribonuclease BN (tRNA processing enzyme)